MTGPISDLRERVTLHEPVRTLDDIGGATIVWTGRGDVWAQIVARGGSGGEAFDGDASFARYDVVIRARADVRAGWRLTWGARTLRIVVATPAPNARLALQCEEERL